MVLTTERCISRATHAEPVGVLEMPSCLDLSGHKVAEFSLACCRTAIKNKKLKSELETIITEAGVTTGCPKQQGTLLYDCASKVSKQKP